MKRILLLLPAIVLMAATAHAQEGFRAVPDTSYKNWVKQVRTYPDEFYQTEDAFRIAENVLLYQHITGGWPKNILMSAVLTGEQMQEVFKNKDDVNESTIDNGATTTEIEYLAKMYNATNDERFRDAVLAGMEYLLKAQYANGGWPQFFPRPTGYYTAITYNDDAMVNVLEFFQKVLAKESPYAFIPDTYAERIQTAFDKGIDCILKTQVRQNGVLTVWCAQHDHVTLEPAKARAYELPSLSGQESDNIVLFLMSLKKPSRQVADAIEAAVKWFEEVRIEDLQKEYYTGEDGRRDYRMVACTGCQPLWARFYELETNRPFFCDRDGVKVYSLAEIGHERRNGYSWYNSDGLKVFREYDKWKKRESISALP